MAYCTACGHAIPNEARFCRFCGSPQEVEVGGQSQPNTAAKHPSGASEDAAVLPIFESGVSKD